MNILSVLYDLLFHGLCVRLGGGGGGGSPKIPEKTTQTVINIPPFVQPYVEQMLGKTQALTSGAQFEPFDPNARFAPTDPLQNQAYSNVAGMQVAPELAQAGQYATGAGNQAGQISQYANPLMNLSVGMGMGAAGMGGQYNQAITNPGTVGQFMSPYMQNVIDVQKDEALRDYYKQLPQMQAAATKAGAYGGSRQAVMQAEGQRNLNQNLTDIQARGQQQAYEDAIRNMQFGSTLGMQGYQTGIQGIGQGVNAANLGLEGANTMLQSASTLGQLGQTGFNQQASIAEMLNAMGTQRQQQEQQKHDFDYQQFVDELNFPYQQLAFMSDMTHGLPMSQSTVYQSSAAPNNNAQLIGAGLQAYGLANRAKGGRITAPKLKQYAAGGQVQVDADAFSAMPADDVAAAVRMLTDEQLAQYAQVVQDAVTLSIIQTEMQRRGRTREPVAQAPASTVSQDTAALATRPAAGLGAVPQRGLRMQAQTEQQVPPPAMMAQGGIVALAGGGKPEAPDPLWQWLRQNAPDQAPVNNLMQRTWDRIKDMNDVRYGSPDDYKARQAEEAAAAAARAGNIAAQGVEQEHRAQFIPNEFAPRPEDVVLPAGPSYGAEDYPPAQAFAVPPPPTATPVGQSAPARPAKAADPVVQLSHVGAVLVSPASAQEGQDNPAGVQSYEDYVRAIDQRASQSLEDQMALDAMRSGLDERTARMKAREHRDNMDALIAAGAAMMQGRTVGEGLALASSAGVAALREATKNRDALQEDIDRAISEQQRYEISLRKDDRKMAEESYSNWRRAADSAEDRAAQLKVAQMRVGADMTMARERNATTLKAAGMRSAGGDPSDERQRMVAANNMVTSSVAYDLLKKLNDPQNRVLIESDPKYKAQYDAAVREVNNTARAAYSALGLPVPDMYLTPEVTGSRPGAGGGGAGPYKVIR